MLPMTHYRPASISSVAVAIFAVAVPLIAILLLAAPATANAPTVYTASDRLAVAGYDPVAYFTDGRPVKGSAKVTLVHQGVTWRFANENNRALFVASPEKYAPQYGGHCAWAVSQGYTASADPTVWKVVGGKLYLNYNASVGRTWEKNPTQNIQRADANWPKLQAK